MRKRLLRLCILLCCFLLILPAMAREIIQGTDCTVEAGQTVEGTLFVLCENLQIDGTITGNIIGLALRANITGQIDGSVYLAGGTLRFSGITTHNLHYGGLSLEVFPTVQTDDEGEIVAEAIRGSILALSLSTQIHAGSTIAESLLIGGYQLLMAGDIGQELNFQGSALILDGAIGSDVYAVVGDPQSSPDQIETLLLPLSVEIDLQNPGLTVSETAGISGSLEYYSPIESEIAGSVSGDVTYIPPDMLPVPSFEEPDTITVYLEQIIREASTLISIGLIGLLLTPGLLSAPLVHLRYRPFSSFSVGMLTFILSFPVLLILLILSVLIVLILQLLDLSGIALAAGVMLGLLNVGSISLFYFVAIFVARVLVGLALGRAIFRLMRFKTTGRMIYVSMVVGILVLALAVSLPVIGWVFNAAALFFGLGGLLSVIMQKFREMRETETIPDASPIWIAPLSQNPLLTARSGIPLLLPGVTKSNIDIPIVTLPASARETPHTPPPLPSDNVPGMENLPQGFDVDFFGNSDDNKQ